MTTDQVRWFVSLELQLSWQGALCCPLPDASSHPRVAGRCPLQYN